ncbi:hypothetical protein EST38_g8511 [Candolleomyces aberdarensis]|uniref:Uncharacterized protein n=1 Tax=Candolleomyces aberdarensis TaxID=2316362 RepID=A0A4V1Q349_9AGAR|nr:hypothetical protein EST38_g8511 [Candolleomyces aberdarensis]
MGGIVLFNHGQYLFPVNPNDLVSVLSDRTGERDYRTRLYHAALPILKSTANTPFTEEEILDRSKGDEVTKGLVLLQTLWFIIQFIARRAQRLNVTELEVVTLAYAALNAVMYLCWWNKPLDVRCPIVISVSVDITDGHPNKEHAGGSASATQQSGASSFAMLYGVLSLRC